MLLADVPVHERTQHTKAELGEIGIREFGECLRAVERAVTGKEGEEEMAARLHHALEARAAGGDSPAGDKEGMKKARHYSTSRLLALAVPSGAAAATAAAAAAGRSAASKASKLHQHCVDEALVIKTEKRGKARGRVVAVVKRPLKRWNTMTGSYADVT